MRDLVVVGGGFFGVAMAAYAQRRGMDVEVFDAVHPGAGSRAASGYWSPRWYDDVRGIERAADTAQMMGVRIEDSRAARINADGSRDGEVRELYTFSRTSLLRCWKGGVHQQQVESLSAKSDGVIVRYRDDDGVLCRMVARTVYVAGGIWTDELLRRSEMAEVGVKPLGGSAAIFSGDGPERVQWVRRSPYSFIGVRRWQAGELRVCATVEATPERTPEARAKMLAAARVAGVLGEEQQPLRWEYGFRPMVDGGLCVREVAPRVVVGTGGGRVGGIQAFQAAESAFRLLERYR